MLMVIIKPILTALVSFREEHIQKEIKKFRGKTNIIANIYKMQA